MSRLTVLIAVVACAVLTSSCSSAERTPALPAELQPEYFPGEQGFLNDVGDRDGIDPRLSDSDLVRVAGRVYNSLFEGRTRAELIPVLTGWDARFTDASASALIVSAKEIMCDQAPLS